MNFRKKNANNRPLNFDPKRQLKNTKPSSSRLNSSIGYIGFFATLIVMVSYFLAKEFVIDQHQYHYAQALPHEVYAKNDDLFVSFDYIDEQDLLTIEAQIKQYSESGAIVESNTPSENISLSNSVSVDPDLLVYQEDPDIIENSDGSIGFEISPNSTTQYTIQSGDSLSKILTFLGFNMSDVNNFITNDEIKKKLRNIKPGQHVEIRTNDQNHITEVRYFYDLLETYVAKLIDDQWQGQTITNEHTLETIRVAAKINNNLEETARKHNINKSVVKKLKSIFKEKIDFTKDIRDGDTFAIIYEYLYINGRAYKPSNLLAAEFNINGERYTAIRHSEEGSNYANYYDIEGKPLITKETFRRHPVDTVRITSKYGPRLHPILKKRKMHHGVDYGAKRGTPIYSVADGKIEFAGRKGSYGITLITKHSSGYKTLFAHMQKIAKGIKSGTLVKKGQLVGYIGNTGRSTGPHLHYELFKGSKRVNPLTAELPREISIPNNQKEQFLANAKVLSRELQSLQSEFLVKNHVNNTFSY